MMPQPAFFPRSRVVHHPGDHAPGLFMAKVRQVNAAQGTCRVELVDSSEPVDAFVMSPHGNGHAGFVWLPEVDDLVVVAMLQGHKALPIVMGSFYAVEDTLPDTAAGACTLHHQSGTVIRIQADGSLTVTGKAGATVTLDAGGDVALQHATSGAELLLDGSGATVSLGSNEVKVDGSHVLLDADSAGGGARIELLPGGGINITPGAGQVVTLAGGAAGVMRAGDITSSPFGGAVADHYHVLQVGSNRVLAG